MYRIFSFSALYFTRTGRNRTPADMLDAIKHDQNKRYLLTNFWGEFSNMKAAREVIRNVIPKSHYQCMIVDYNASKNAAGKFEHLYEGVIVYEDCRPIIVYGKVEDDETIGNAYKRRYGY